MVERKIILTAEDRTRAAFESAQGSVQKLGSLIDAIPGFSGIAASLAVLAGGGAIKGVITDAINAADGLNDMADAVGASIENLSALKSVAMANGHEFSSVEAGLIKLSQALHSTDDESKGAAKAFSAIGLSMSELKDIDPAEAMLKVATALDRYQDGSAKAAVATAIFGKSGAALLPYLKDLAEQGELVGKTTAEMAAQAEQYNKGVKKIESSMGIWKKMLVSEVLPQLVKFVDNMNYAIKSSDGFWSSLWNGVARNPFKSHGQRITELKAEYEQLDFMVSNGRAPDEEKSKARMAQIQEELDFYQKAQKAFEPQKPEVKEKLKFDGKPKDDGAEKVTEYQRLIQTLTEKISVETAAQSSAEKLIAAEKEFSTYQADLLSGKLKLTDAEKAVATAYWETYLARAKANEQEKESKKANELVSDYQRNNAMVLERIQRERELALMTERQRTVAKALYQVEDEGAKIRERILHDLPEGVARTEALAKAEEALAAQKEKVKTATEASYDSQRSFEFGWAKAFQSYEDNALNAARTAETAFGSLADSMTGAIKTFTRTGKLDFKNFSDSVISMLVDIQMQALKTNVLKPIMSDAGGWLGSLFGGSSFVSSGYSDLGSGLTLGSVSASAGLPFAKGGAFSAPGGLHDYVNQVRDTPTPFGFDLLQPFAHGGIFAEAGPEAVMPLTRDDSGNLGVRAVGAQPGNVRVEIVNQGQPPKAVDSATARFDSAGLVVRVVLNDVATGGPISSALGRQFGLNRAAAGA